MSHSPAPWGMTVAHEVGKPSAVTVYAADGTTVLSDTYEKDGPIKPTEGPPNARCPERIEADARLVAAAPLIAEQLARVVSAFDRGLLTLDPLITGLVADCRRALRTGGLR